MKRKTLIILITLLFISLHSEACTIFSMTDGDNVIFGNNEDYSNPRTRIWFTPGKNRHYGCVWVGFNNWWAQGGVNEKGLAFDWVAGYDGEGYKPAREMKRFIGNPAQRMLETCVTIEDAITFFKKYREPAFGYAKILIADKSGNSVIIGSYGGKLSFELSNTSRSLGFGENVFEDMIASNSQTEIENAARILDACRQHGKYATKYSVIYDLVHGEIFLYRFDAGNTPFRLNINGELSKEEHYYDIPEIDRQATMPVKRLPVIAKRMFWICCFFVLLVGTVIFAYKGTRFIFKRLFYVTVISICLCSCVQNNQKNKDMNQKNLASIIIAMEKAALDELNKGNPLGFLEIYADDFTYFDPQQEKRIDGFEKIRTYYESLPAFSTERYEMIDPVVQIAGEMAVLSYNLVTYIGDEVFRENCTEVYRQQPDKQWKIIHSHFSPTKAKE